MPPLAGLPPTIRLFNTGRYSVRCLNKACTQCGTAPDVAHNGFRLPMLCLPQREYAQTLVHPAQAVLAVMDRCLPLASARDREPVSNTGCTTSSYRRVQRLQVRSRSCMSGPCPPAGGRTAWAQRGLPQTCSLPSFVWPKRSHSCLRDLPGILSIEKAFPPGAHTTPLPVLCYDRLVYGGAQKIPDPPHTTPYPKPCFHRQV